MSSSTRSSRRSTLVDRVAVSGGLVLLCASLGACSNEEEARIVAERSRFRDVVPEEYVIAACGTGHAEGCTREVVIAGRVVTAEVQSGVDTWRPVAELGAWVDQVTVMFEAALDYSGSLRTLEFEPRWHYVSEYHLEDGGGDGRKVTCFLPNRVDLQQCNWGEAVAAP